MSSLSDPHEVITFKKQLASGSIKPFHGANLRWFNKPTHNEAKSLEAGRAIYDNVEMVEISFPGSVDKVSKVVTEQIKAHYPEAYAAFKAGNEMPLEGTPIETWAMLPINVVKEFKYLGINTLEQLAESPESVRKRLGTAQKWIEEAKHYLQSAKGGSGVTKLRAEIKSLKTEIKGLEAKNKDLAKEIKKLKEDKDS